MGYKELSPSFDIVKVSTSQGGLNFSPPTTHTLPQLRAMTSLVPNKLQSLTMTSQTREYTSVESFLLIGNQNSKPHALLNLSGRGFFLLFLYFIIALYNFVIVILFFPRITSTRTC